MIDIWFDLYLPMYMSIFNLTLSNATLSSIYDMFNLLNNHLESDMSRASPWL